MTRKKTLLFDGDSNVFGKQPMTSLGDHGHYGANVR